MNHLWHDLRYGTRSLMNKPAFTAAAVLVLALGIGANSAMFSLINAFLLKPLHVEQPDQLAGLYDRDAKHRDAYRAFSYPNYVDIRRSNPAFSSLAALNLAMIGIQEPGIQEGASTRRAFAAIVSSNYFSTLGVAILNGRSFLPAEEIPGTGLTAVVSYRYWQKTGQDPHLIGKGVRINGHLFTIVGVAPQGFTGTTALVSPEIFVPLGSYNLVMNDFEGHGKPLAARDNGALILFGRLKPGVSLKSADASFAVVASQLEKAFPAENKDRELIVRPLSRMSISTNPSTADGMLRIPAVMLLSLACVVLLIASLNLANMMMARGMARRKEIAIRLAIGGSRASIVRQLVTEGFLLALLGGAGGLVVASWSTTLLVQSLRGIAPIDLVYDASPDSRVLFFTLFLCLLSTVVFSLFPARKLSKPDVWVELKENTGEDLAGRRRLFSRSNTLVMAQLSLSLMMLTAAGLFVHSAVRAANIEPGFALDNEVLAEVDASLINYDEKRAAQLYQTLEARLRQMPGVKSVAFAATVPFGMTLLGKHISASKDRPALEARYNIVSQDYFQTLSIPMLRGRAFTAAENTTGSKSTVAIIDKLAADKLWPKGDAIGKRIHLDDSPKDSADPEVIGVVGNIRENILGAALEPHVYVPFGQAFQANVQFHIKAADGLLETIRQQIRATDEQLPVLALKTMRGHLESGIDIWIVRTGARVLEIFGAVALFLAVIGLYALNAYAVARRTREIGIRMALGADASSTLRMVLTGSLKITLVGLGAGLLLATALSRVLASFLYDIPKLDVLVLGTAPALLGLVALVACYVPARRAAQVDPIIALRYE